MAVEVPAIEIERLTKRYGSAAPAVDGVGLRIEPGTVFGFLGPNGAGKTTTIKIAAGLLTADSGRVRLNGFDVARERARAMAQFGAVLEGSRNGYWTLSAWQHLLYFGRFKGMRTAAALSRTVVPIAPGVEALRDILLSGGSLTDPDTGWGLGWLLLQPFLLVATGVVLFSRLERAAKRRGTLSRY